MIILTIILLVILFRPFRRFVFSLFKGLFAVLGVTYIVTRSSERIR